MSALLPCPFCGDEADLFEKDHGWGVECICGAKVGVFVRASFATEAWNTRPDAITALRADVTRLTASLAAALTVTDEMVERAAAAQWVSWHSDYAWGDAPESLRQECRRDARVGLTAALSAPAS